MAKTVNKSENPLWARWVIGMLVALLAAGFVIGFGWIVLNPLKGLETVFDAKTLNQAKEALIMLFAGGVGSSIYAIRAYLIHACEDKDVDPGYIPWYPFRIFLGALLALIFYFVLRGGLLFFTIKGEEKALENLNIWSLAAAGSLVGLFSKYAMEKLRDVFMTLFGDQGEKMGSKKPK